jgi:hypothetical protein
MISRSYDFHFDLVLAVLDPFVADRVEPFDVDVWPSQRAVFSPDPLILAQELQGEAHWTWAHFLAQLLQGAVGGKTPLPKGPKWENTETIRINGPQGPGSTKRVTL